MGFEAIIAVILGIFAFHAATFWFTGKLYYWLMYRDNNPEELSCLTWPIVFVVEIYWRIYYKTHKKESEIDGN